MLEKSAALRKPRRKKRPASPAPQAIAAPLLDWYDRAGRDLPWRARGGARAEPYHVWLSEIMLQQTGVASVMPYFAAFLARWPSVEALAAAPDKEILAAWAGLGYYARARNLIACARRLAAAGGRFPDSEAGLRALPGIGDYTAAAIAAIAFGRPATVVDGNIERIVARLFALAEALPQARPRVKALLAPLVPPSRPGDFAQALMDLGAMICTPRTPDCPRCPLRQPCAARAAGNPMAYPLKVKKPTRPIKYGTAYVLRDPAGRVLLGMRAARGLLGGMAEVPNTGWASAAPRPAPPVTAPWRQLNAPVIHVFTHFELRLGVAMAEVAAMPAPAGLHWVAPEDLDQEPLPTLFRKVLAAAKV